MDTWQLIATERTRLLDTLEGLSEEDWDSAAMCGGWTNKQALAHIIATAEVTQGKFFTGVAKNGFNFHAMVASDIRRVAADSPEQMLRRFRGDIPSHNHPPGPVASMLMETVVHGEDIAFPLGLSIDHSKEALLATADFAKNAQPLVGVKKRIAGLTLQAMDADWSTGNGPQVRGPLVPLLLGMCGRKPAMERLYGAGVEILRQRP